MQQFKTTTVTAATRANNDTFSTISHVWIVVIRVKNSGYTNLIRLQDVIPPEYDSLLEELAILYDNHYANVIDRELRYKERTGKFEDIFFEHYDWFSSQIPLKF